MYIAENSPVGSTVGEIHARDPDEGPNAVVQYSIIGKSFNEKHIKV
jgi:cadherin EGF LAG seven-pass G-type receptor 1